MFAPYIIGLAVLFTSMIASRAMSERALRLLSDQEKLSLINSFSWLRAWGSIPFIPILAIFIGSSFLRGWLAWIAFTIGWLLVIAYFAWTHIIVFKKLRELQISTAYQYAFARTRYLVYVGFGVFFVSVMLPLFLT